MIFLRERHRAGFEARVASSWSHGLGDAASDQISAALNSIAAGQRSSSQAISGSLATLQHAAAVRPDFWTDYVGGELRGWFRTFGSTGAYGVIPAPKGPGTIGAPPSDQEWQAFDARARELGVSGFVDSLRAAAQADSSNFFDQANEGLKTFDQTVIRPTVKGVQLVEQTLDKYVPGWVVIVDLLAPALPFLPLITQSIAAAANLAPEVVAQAFEASSDALRGFSQALGPNDASTALGRAANVVQGDVANVATYVARVATQTGQTLDPLTPFQASLGKAIATFQTTDGQLWNKLLATSLEVVNEASLALSIAGTVLTLGAASPAIAALTTGIQATLGATVTAWVAAASAVTKALLASAQLVSVLEQAHALKAAAAQAKAAAAQESAQLDQETAELEQEIAQLRQLQAQRAGLARSSGPSSGPSTAAKVGLLGLGVLLLREVLS